MDRSPEFLGKILGKRPVLILCRHPGRYFKGSNRDFHGLNRRECSLRKLSFSWGEGGLVEKGEERTEEAVDIFVDLGPWDGGALDKNSESPTVGGIS